MKWMIFAVGLAGVLPFGWWLRSNPRALTTVWMVIGALPFLMSASPKYEITIFGNPEWPGYTQGFQISVMDLIIWAVYFGTSPTGLATPTKLPFKVPFLFYLGTVLLSALQAPEPMASLWFAWQLLRIFIVYTVIARACVDARITTSVLTGMAFGLCFEACFVLWQRFVVHLFHVTGTFNHQNMVGIATYFVVFPFFALLLSGQKRDWKPAAIPIIGVIMDIISSSRAAFAFTGTGFLLLFLLSVLRKWSGRKVKILVMALCVVVLLSPLAYRQYELRFASSGLPSIEGTDRVHLNYAAQLILDNNPMGIGANNFFVVATGRDGYYIRAQVDVLANNLMPHSAYWTTAAEIGYIGFVALMIFLISPLMLALSCGWRSPPNDQRGDLLLGLSTSLLMVYAHSHFEWALLDDLTQYFLAINIGLVAGLAQQIGQKKLSHDRPKNTIDLSPA